MVIVVGNESPVVSYDTQSRYMMMSGGLEAASARIAYTNWMNAALRSRIADIADAIAPRVTQENRSADNSQTWRHPRAEIRPRVTQENRSADNASTIAEDF
jgi:hypothetical protein